MECTDIVRYDPDSALLSFLYQELIEIAQDICPKCRNRMIVERYGMGGSGDATSLEDFLFPFDSLQLDHAERYRIMECRGPKGCGHHEKVVTWSWNREAAVVSLQKQCKLPPYIAHSMPFQRLPG